MQCPRCRLENREGRHFCAECGAPLGQSCPACSFSNEPGEKFCGGCGQPLAAPAGASARFESPQSYTPKRLADKILVSRGAMEAAYHEAIGLALELGMRPLLARSHLGLGRLYRGTGNRRAAADHLSTAIA